MSHPAERLQPGDCLLYAATGTFGRLISWITWHPVGHVEIYIGNGRSVAARNGIGVNQYPLRLADLIRVRRPAQPFHLPAALAWFLTQAKGQGYDWLGLLRFRTTGKVSTKLDSPTKQFCSEFATRFYGQGGFYPFGEEDADAIAPFQFDTSALLPCIWTGRLNKDGQ
jgi:hypothetical protein